MKTSIFSILFVLSSFFCFAANAAAPAETLASSERMPFNKGERILFGIYSNGIRVGSGELRYLGVKKEGLLTGQKIYFKATTFSIWDGEDIFGLLDFSAPMRVERFVRLFGKKEEISEFYAKDGLSVRIEKKSGEVFSEETIVSSAPLTNVLLLIYRLRLDPNIAVGREYDIVLPTQKFKLLVKGRRRLKVPLGVFEVFYVESEPSKYRFWITADEHRLPVRIQGVIGGGMVYLAATGISSASSLETPPLEP